jgi:hypothetical protein
MVRSAFVAACVFACAVSLFGQNCDLSNPNATQAMCTSPISAGQSSRCTVTITNLGAGNCSGTFGAAVGALDPGTASNGNSSLGGCSVVSNYPLPAPTFNFTTVVSAVVCQGVMTLAPGASVSVSGDVTPSPSFTGSTFNAGYVGFFQNSSGGGTTAIKSWGNLVVDISNCTAVPSAAGAAPSATPYVISWNATGSGGPYEIQEATTSDFSNASTISESSTAHTFQHTVGSATTFFYRVRPLTCSGSAGTFGPSVSVVVLPPQPPTSRDFDLVVPAGTTTQVSQDVTFSGLTPNAPFTASTDEPFLTITPTSGVVRSNGTVTVTVKANPNGLQTGANTGTVSISLNTATGPGGKGRIVPNDSRSTSTTVSVSLVTPVNSNPKGMPPNDALIVPAVAHLEGAATFRSDVRITNAGTTTAVYLLSFTPQNSDGSMTGKQTQISIGAGQTVALNDILKDYFGFADPSAQAGGVLDIRVVSGGSAATTYVSSRTYAATPNGTYGQFVPAVPISRFLKQGGGSLTLTHVANSPQFRTNIGLVEGLGANVSGHIRFFSASGQSLGADFPFTLRPFEFKQLGGLIPSSTDARIEVINDSPNAGITTYASVLDQVTQDPLLVSPIQTATLSANRCVLPGMADFANPGASNFHSDVRIFNASAFTVNAAATFYPQANGAPIAKDISILPGEIKVYNNVLPALFGTTGPQGGAIVVTTPNNVPLIVSGRTYSNADTGGTFGQFIPAVTPADGVGLSDGPLQVLQLEQSANFRSNVGFNELTGNPVTLQVTLIPSGSKVAAVLPDITLQGNEFRQESGIFGRAFPGQNIYNGRVTVKVIGGTGRVTAYGSVVDNLTSDPTYVPAQK